MERVNAFILACLISVSIALITVLVCPPQKTPSVKPNEKAEHRIDNHDGAGAQTSRSAPSESFSAEIVPLGAEKKGQAEGQHGSEEGTEFWPPFFGYKLKITDTLLALFTAGLLIATWYLFLATRRLVRGAEDTARRQLRAYVFIDGGSIDYIIANDLAVMLTGHVWLKNFGGTPAYDCRIWTRIDVFNDPRATLSASSGNTKTIVGPSAICTSTVSKGPITQNDLRAINSNEKFVFFWGEIEYRDAFNSVHRYRFHFCTGHELSNGQGWEIDASPHHPDHETEERPHGARS
jgi:hypothetical protein